MSTSAKAPHEYVLWLSDGGVLSGTFSLLEHAQCASTSTFILVIGMPSLSHAAIQASAWQLNRWFWRPPVPVLILYLYGDLPTPTLCFCLSGSYLSDKGKSCNSEDILAEKTGPMGPCLFKKGLHIISLLICSRPGCLSCRTPKWAVWPWTWCTVSARIWWWNCPKSSSCGWRSLCMLASLVRIWQRSWR